MTLATEPRLGRPPRTNWPAVYDGRASMLWVEQMCPWQQKNEKLVLRRSNCSVTYVMEDLSEEHQALYTWIDEIPLSRQKKHVARDFSDGGKLHKHDKQTPMGRTELLFQNILFAEA